MCVLTCEHLRLRGFSQNICKTFFLGLHTWFMTPAIPEDFGQATRIQTYQR